MITITHFFQLIYVNINTAYELKTFSFVHKLPQSILNKKYAQYFLVFRLPKNSVCPKPSFYLNSLTF